MASKPWISARLVERAPPRVEEPGEEARGRGPEPGEDEAEGEDYDQPECHKAQQESSHSRRGLNPDLPLARPKLNESTNYPQMWRGERGQLKYEGSFRPTSREAAPW